DAVEHARADDAAGAPDRSDLAEVETPAVLRAGRTHLLEALRIGDDLGCVERVADGVEVCRAGLLRRKLGMREQGFRPGAKVPPAREGAGVDRFGDRGD